MKVGIVGVGAVGSATALSLIERGGVCRELVLAGVGVAGLDTPQPNLEDLFVGLTGEGFDVDG